MEPHHIAWLANHPNRSEEWLRDKLREGFDVHHLDGDHNNNVPDNLVLMEHIDHMRLHGSVMAVGRLRYLKNKPKIIDRLRKTLAEADTILNNKKTKALFTVFANNPAMRDNVLIMLEGDRYPGNWHIAVSALWKFPEYRPRLLAIIEEQKRLIAETINNPPKWQKLID